MKKLILLLLLLITLLPQYASAAIQYDSSHSLNSSGTTCTISGVAPANGFLVVGFLTGESSDNLTNVTWNTTETLTIANSGYNSNEFRYEYLAYLENPTAGSYDIDINFGSSVGACYGFAVFYKSDDGNDLLFDTDTFYRPGSVSTLTTTNTSTVDNTWQVSYSDSGDGTLSCDGSTVRSSTFGSNILCDSNGTTGVAGAKTLTVDNTSARYISTRMLGFYESTTPPAPPDTPTITFEGAFSDSLYFFLFMSSMGFLVGLFYVGLFSWLRW